jgi:hypothetical protein
VRRLFFGTHRRAHVRVADGAGQRLLAGGMRNLLHPALCAPVYSVARLTRSHSHVARCNSFVVAGNRQSWTCFPKTTTSASTLDSVDTAYVETGLVGSCSASSQSSAPSDAKAACANIGGTTPSQGARRARRDGRRCEDRGEGHARCDVPGQLGASDCVDLLNSNDSWCVIRSAAVRSCAHLARAAASATRRAPPATSLTLSMPPAREAGASSVRSRTSSSLR